MAVSDPKSFYNHIMPGKPGFVDGYEQARWGANPFLATQYQMARDALQRLVLRHVRVASRILEVGPGPGTWTKVLLEENPAAQYTLVDISSEMLSQARASLSLRKNIVFTESDFAAFTSNKYFDFFFSSRAIEYMPDKAVVARKITEILSPGAYGAIVTKMPKPLFDRVKGRSVDGLHGGQISPGLLRRHIKQSGCVVISVRIATATVPGFRSPSLNMLAYRILRHIPLFFPFSLFAESYVAVFRKRA